MQNDNTPTIDPLTVDESARELRCGAMSIRRAIWSGELKAIRVNERGDYRIYRIWLQEWIDARLAKQTAAIPVKPHEAVVGV